jgi:hypothetical protein
VAEEFHPLLRERQAQTRAATLPAPATSP